jgi:hypothetical protein
MVIPMLKGMIRAAVLFSAVAVSGVMAQSGPTNDADVASTLRALNQSFIASYHAQNKMVRSALPPIIVIRSDSISLLNQDKTTIYAFSSQIQEVKSALHATLGFQGLMRVAAVNPSPQIWADLMQFDQQLSELRPLLQQSRADQATRDETHAAVDIMQAAVQKALAQRSVSDKSVREALGQARPHLMKAVEQIGQVSIAQMMDVLRAVEQSMSASQWSEVIVVVPGPATARVDNLAIASAIEILGQSALGRRIFYSEGVYDDKAIEAYVLMLKRDQGLSDMLFDDPYRMWRDVFADVSRQYVEGDYVVPLAQEPK